MCSDPLVPHLRQWLAVLAAMTSIGCSPSRESADVSGRVTLNGEPQEGIYIYFQPAVTKGVDPMDVGPSSYARTDADGHYSLEVMNADEKVEENVDQDRHGALVGTHIVSADDERTFGGVAERDGDASPQERNPDGSRKSRVPRNWSATFVVTKQGTTGADFELDEKTTAE